MARVKYWLVYFHRVFDLISWWKHFAVSALGNIYFVRIEIICLSSSCWRVFSPFSCSLGRLFILPSKNEAGLGHSFFSRYNMINLWATNYSTDAELKKEFYCSVYYSTIHIRMLIQRLQKWWIENPSLLICVNTI